MTQVVFEHELAALVAASPQLRRALDAELDRRPFLDSALHMLGERGA